MKKVCIFALFTTLFLASCGGSSNDQTTDNETIKELSHLDSLNTELDATIKEIDQSESDLDAALEELDD